MLFDRDYRNVRELHGGLSDWLDAGYTVTPVPELTFASTHTENIYQPRLGFTAGGSTFDFLLKNPDGVEYQLSKLLTDKPVMLQFGSYT